MKLIALHIAWFAISMAIVASLFTWTMAATRPLMGEIEVAQSKPWRIPARLAFTAITATLLFGTQALVASKQRFG